MKSFSKWKAPDPNVYAAYAGCIVALFTVWLTYDTHRLAQIAAFSNSLDERVLLVTNCNVDTTDDVQSHDSIIEIKTNDTDGYEVSDELSAADIKKSYLNHSRQDYLRCTITNYSHGPLLNVQVAFSADYQKNRKVEIFSTRFHVIAPQASKTMWFANNGRDAVVIHFPHRERYSTLADSRRIALDQPTPFLLDTWTLYRERDVAEDLDQSEMSF